MNHNPDSNSSEGLTRRHAVKLLGGGASISLVTALVPKAAVALKQFEVGPSQLLIVSDGNLVLPASFIYPHIPEAERSAAFKANGLPTDLVKPDCNVVVFKAGSRTILFDTGSGANFMPSAGKLLDNLKETGIDPANVTDVIFTHAHPDHLWGLTNEFDELVFPSATYRMSQIEWDYWLNPDTISQTPDERKSFVVGAQSRMPLIKDKLEAFESGAEVLPGIEALGTPGHTPGHTSFVIHGGPAPIIITGDVLSNTVSFSNPGWHWGTDHDPVQGVETRKRLLDRAKSDRARLIGFHLPHPGDGMVEGQGPAYRFAPAG